VKLALLLLIIIFIIQLDQLVSHSIFIQNRFLYQKNAEILLGLAISDLKEPETMFRQAHEAIDRVLRKKFVFLVRAEKAYGMSTVCLHS